MPVWLRQKLHVPRENRKGLQGKYTRRIVCTEFLSHVVLAVVYHVVLAPIGLVRRLLGGDPLRRRFDRGADTCWIERGEPPDASSCLRPF